jgi:hypothetical protein
MSVITVRLPEELEAAVVAFRVLTIDGAVEIVQGSKWDIAFKAQQAENDLRQLIAELMARAERLRLVAKDAVGEWDVFGTTEEMLGLHPGDLDDDLQAHNVESPAE